MKKTFKITAIVLGIIIILMLILPFAFKGKIIKTIKEEANSSMNAKLDFTDFGMSMFRSFPNFSLSIEKLSIVGVDQFKGDTLASMDKMYVSIDLMSVIKGSGYKIKKIELDNPRILLKRLKDGKANWDIAKPADTTKPKEPSKPSNFKMTLQKIVVTNAHFIFDDASLGFYILMDGMNHTSSGDMTADITNLITATTIKHLDVAYGGVKYLSKCDVDLKATIEANMKDMKFTFKDNMSRLNQLYFKFDGFFAMLNPAGFDMDLKFSTDKTEFKNILSMVPSLYAKDFNKIQTSGKFVFNGFAKGIYKDLTLPAFGLNFQIINAMFKYPSLPKEVNNINIVTKIDNKGGSADNTTIDVSTFHVALAGNPIDMTLFLSTPMSDPSINMGIKGSLDLASIKQVYPLAEGQDLNGMFKADITLKGKMSAIQKQKYNEFVAQGYLDLKNMMYKSKDFAQGVNITAAHFNFNPQYLELAQFDMLMGRNDFSAKGKIQNYIAYWLKGETIKGQLSTSSKYFNLDDVMPKDTLTVAKKSSEAAKDTVAKAMTVVKIPANIDFVMTTSFGKLIYDKMEMANVKGEIDIKDEKVQMKNLSMNICDGKMVVTGYYSSKDKDKPEADFALDISNFNIPKAAKTFVTFGKMAPIAENTTGTFSTKFKINTLMNTTMSPILNSMRGSGTIATSKLKIDNSTSLLKLAETTKMDNLKHLELNNINLSFVINDGKVYTSPFEIKTGNIKAIVSGSTCFDQTIDYLLKMEMPRKEFGGGVGSLFEGMSAFGSSKGVKVKVSDNIKFNIIIKGTFSKPKITTSFGNGKDNAVNSAKDALKNEAITTVKADAAKVIAEAQQKADQLIKEAQKQGDALRSEAKKAGDKLVAEADAQGQKLVDEASNPISKAVAQKGATKLHNEAKTKADKMNTEADTKAKDLVSKAKSQGDGIIKAAQDKTK